MRTLLLFVLLAVSTPAFAASFSDVSYEHQSSAAIEYVKAQGIVEGYADGTFRPGAAINRAEFMKILHKTNLMLITERQKQYPEGPFWEDSMCIAVFNDSEIGLPLSDVEKSAWYAHAVCHGLSQGLITGYPDGTFRPESAINFVEASKILAATFKIGEPPQVCDDNGRCTGEHPNDPWYKRHVDALANGGAIPESIQGFDHAITRGEMAEMIYRLKTGIDDKPSLSYDDLASGAAMKTYCDDVGGFCFEYPADWKIGSYYPPTGQDMLGIVSMDHPTVMTGDTEVWIQMYPASADRSRTLYTKEEDKACYNTQNGEECVYCEIWPGGTYAAGVKGIEFMKKSTQTLCEERGSCETSCVDLQVRSTIVTIGDVMLLIKTVGGEELYEQYNRTIETLRTK